MNLQVFVNFEVIDESDDWIIVNKPAPLIVHPTNRKAEPTLLGGLEQLLAFEIASGACLGIVNRLDRETSGVVLVAKTKSAARKLGMIFECRAAVKEYLAIVINWPEIDDWENCQSINRAGEFGHSEIWVKQLVSPAGRECSTRFRVEERFLREGKKYSVIRCFPKTGRMHQIRVHLADSGFPIVGDKLYSRQGEEYLTWMAHGWTEELERQLILPRHALHAASLSVPWNGEMTFWEAPMAVDLKNFISGQVIESSPDIVIWNRDD
jgi:23S rRNA pseudouridine1911/1915/1917 synthase